MSKAMSWAEFRHLMNYIEVNHSPRRMAASKGRGVVKYVRPNIDMRTCEVFSLTLTFYGAVDVFLHTQNECSGLPDSLLTRTLAVLKGET